MINCSPSYKLFVLLVTFLGLGAGIGAVVLDRCNVPMLEVDLKFTLLNLESSNTPYKIDFLPFQDALIAGYGTWQFSVSQNVLNRVDKVLRVGIKCGRLPH